MKAFSQRVFFQFGVGFLYGASFCMTDGIGRVLLIIGAAVGALVYG